MDRGTWPEIIRYGQAVCSTLGCDDVQMRALPDFTRLTRGDSSGIYLFDHRYKATVASVLGAPTTLLYEFEQVDRRTCAFLHRAVTTRFPVHDAMLYGSPNAHRKAPRGRLLYAYGFEHCMLTPLVHNGRCIGAVSVARAIGRPVFTVEDLRVADHLGRFISIALANAARHETVRMLAGSSAGDARRTSSAAASDLAVKTIRLADGESLVMPAAQRVAATDLDAVLTRREIEVFELLANGLSNAEIAGELTIAVNTVKQHVKHIYRKLGARSRLEAAQRGGASMYV